MRSKSVLSTSAALLVGMISVARAAPPPDLVIDSFTAKATHTTVLYTVIVCNISKNGAAPASFLGLYYDQAAAPSCSTTPNHSWSVPALQTGACQTLSHNRTNTPLGTYKSWVLADRTCALKEAFETNNTASEQLLVIPELTVVDLTASVAADRAVTFSATIANDGIAVAYPFEVGLLYDKSDSPDCGDPVDAAWQLTALASKQSATHDFVRAAGVPAGIYRAWVYADRACIVTENSEDNNTESITYVVGPNIRLSDPQAAAATATVTYRVTVCNEGSEETGPFDVDLWYNRASNATCSTSGANHTWTQSSLAPDDCATLTHTRAAVVSGSYEAQFLADSDCDVSEASEQDNVAAQGYSVAGHDLYVSSFTTTIVNKTSIRYEATVCNSGAAVTKSFTAGIYFNRASQPDCSTTPSHEKTLSGLAKGACETVVATRDNLQPGDRLAWAMVDSSCDVIEDSESNNRESSATTISAWPDLTVVEVTADVQDDTVWIYATVCNDGMADAPVSLSGFYLQRDEPPPPDCSVVPHQTQQVPALAAGACTNQVWIREGVPAGSYTGYVTVDVDCALDELVDTNNSTAIAYGQTTDDASTPVQDASADSAAVDAGPGDASQEQPASDAATDAGSVEGGSGCGCDVSVEPRLSALMLALFLVLARRRRSPAR